MTGIVFWVGIFVVTLFGMTIAFLGVMAFAAIVQSAIDALVKAHREGRFP